jgi:hypothetical protein
MKPSGELAQELKWGTLAHFFIDSQATLSKIHRIGNRVMQPIKAMQGCSLCILLAKGKLTISKLCLISFFN